MDDVKFRIRELSNKSYAVGEENTLDYVLLFIPNEQVYGFINTEHPGIIDETLRKKIILCSPWTLYAVLRIIWQAWQNYHYSEGIRNIIGVIQEFRSEFQKFRSCMDTVGERLGKAQDSYQQMVGVRQRKLDKKIEKIEKIEQFGEEQSLAELPAGVDED